MYCNHLPTSTTNQRKEICVPTKNDNLQVYFAQGCEKQHFGCSGRFFLLFFVLFVASSFSINAAVAFSPWSPNVIISSIIEKEEAGTVQREEKEMSTAASHNLAKIYLQIVIFSRNTYFFLLICSTSWQVITILVWSFMTLPFPKDTEII